MSLHDIMNIRATVLVELDVMSRAFFYLRESFAGQVVIIAIESM